MEDLCLPIWASSNTGFDSLALRHFSFIFLFKQKKHKNLLKNRKKSIPKSPIKKPWKIIKNGLQNGPRGSKMTPRGAKMGPKGPNLGQKGAKRDPKKFNQKPNPLYTKL